MATAILRMNFDDLLIEKISVFLLLYLSAIPLQVPNHCLLPRRSAIGVLSMPRRRKAMRPSGRSLRLAA
jgi:hypothetical protein